MRARLTWNEKQELRDLPTRIETLEEEQRTLHEQMADPGFYQQAGELIARAQAELEALGDEILAAYARWESLEEKEGDAE